MFISAWWLLLLTSSFSVSCASNPDKMIKTFFAKLNEHFNSGLSSFIAERDALLPLLDFPESLQKVFESRESVRLNHIYWLTILHLNSKKDNFENTKDLIAFDNVKNNIAMFCFDFDTAYNALIKKEAATITDIEIDRLIFDVEINFEKFLKSGFESKFDKRKAENQEKSWAALNEAFSSISMESHQHLDRFREIGIFHLFADFPLF